MRDKRAVPIALVAVVMLASNVIAPGDAQQPTGIEHVAWLQGCWEMVSTNRTIEEHWMAPRGKSMLAMSRILREGQLVGYELIVLREEGEQLAYQAHPSGQATAVFLSLTVSNTMVVFENREHDFPQRIGYQREKPDSLLAWIEGKSGGLERRNDLAYRRVGCP